MPPVPEEACSDHDTVLISRANPTRDVSSASLESEPPFTSEIRSLLEADSDDYTPRIGRAIDNVDVAFDEPFALGTALNRLRPAGWQGLDVRWPASIGSAYVQNFLIYLADRKPIDDILKTQTPSDLREHLRRVDAEVWRAENAPLDGQTSHAWAWRAVRARFRRKFLVGVCLERGMPAAGLEGLVPSLDDALGLSDLVTQWALGDAVASPTSPIDTIRGPHGYDLYSADLFWIGRNPTMGVRLAPPVARALRSRLASLNRHDATRFGWNPPEAQSWPGDPFWSVQTYAGQDLLTDFLASHANGAERFIKNEANPDNGRLTPQSVERMTGLADHFHMQALLSGSPSLGRDTFLQYLIWRWRVYFALGGLIYRGINYRLTTIYTPKFSEMQVGLIERALETWLNHPLGGLDRSPLVQDLWPERVRLTDYLNAAGISERQLFGACALFPELLAQILKLPDPVARYPLTASEPPQEQWISVQTVNKPIPRPHSTVSPGKTKLDSPPPEAKPEASYLSWHLRETPENLSKMPRPLREQAYRDGAVAVLPDGTSIPEAWIATETTRPSGYGIDGKQAVVHDYACWALRHGKPILAQGDGALILNYAGGGTIHALKNTPSDKTQSVDLLIDPQSPLGKVLDGEADGDQGWKCLPRRTGDAAQLARVFGRIADGFRVVAYLRHGDVRLPVAIYRSETAAIGFLTPIDDLVRSKLAELIECLRPDSASSHAP